MKKLLFTLFFVLGSMATALAENYPYRADYLWLTVPKCRSAYMACHRM